MGPGITKFDVLIIGGGPAGSAAAIKLGEAGVSAAILERTRYEGSRIGETLPPEANLVLKALGVWDEFINDAHLESPGNISAWGSEVLEERDFIFGPHGCGWHVDRTKFDRTLSRCVERSGAKVIGGTEVTGHTRLDGRKWRVTAKNGGRSVLFEADHLLYATGRRARLSLPVGTKRTVDKMVSLVKLFDPAVSITELDHRTLVESDINGWWYSSVLPQNQVIAAYMTDADLLPKGAGESAEIWRQLLSGAPHTRQRVRDMVLRETLVVPASSYLNSQLAGDGWMAIGDAAFTLDPLTSMGITSALDRGMEAAKAMIDSLQSGKRDLPGCLDETKLFFSRYLKERQAYYDLERRWETSPFWQRRHSVQ